MCVVCACCGACAQRLNQCQDDRSLSPLPPCCTLQAPFPSLEGAGVTSVISSRSLRKERERERTCRRCLLRAPRPGSQLVGWGRSQGAGGREGPGALPRRLHPVTCSLGEAIEMMAETRPRLTCEHFRTPRDLTHARGHDDPRGCKGHRGRLSSEDASTPGRPAPRCQVGCPGYTRGPTHPEPSRCHWHWPPIEPSRLPQSSVSYLHLHVRPCVRTVPPVVASAGTGRCPATPQRPGRGCPWPRRVVLLVRFCRQQRARHTCVS